MNKELEKVKLLIFDFDGTMAYSVKANLAAANFCLPKLDYPKITLTKIKKHTGEAAAEFYPHLIKGKNKKDWPRLKSCMEGSLPYFFNQHLKLFPQVKQTLKKLKDRGFKLVLYSNAPLPYFQAAVKASGLKPYFHFTQELKPRATKTSTIKKIIKKYKLPAAVIGDREHDFIAAKNNNAPSIACLFGFGNKKEQRLADFSIKEFKDLLKLFK